MGTPSYSNSYFSLTAAPYITLSSPNGGESWQLGSTHNISWQSNAGGSVKIELYKGSSKYKTISSSTSNDGSYSWSIPSNYDAYSNYKIKITSTSNSSLYDYSNNYFSLISASAYITVTSPNGGESWQLGSSHTISWNSNASGNVKIELYKSGSYYRTITSSTSNDGSYSWSIPSNYDAYSNYKIKITSTSNSSLYDYSNNYFSLTSASAYITVTSPNGGESWQLGSTHTISWNSNASGNVKIELYKSGSYYRTITSSTSNDGSYNWSIPSSYNASSSYKIKIKSTSNSSLYDYSNSYFSLTSIEDVPSPPSLSSPPNGSIDHETSLTLSWNSSSGATDYHIQVSISSSFNSTIVDASGITGTSKSISGLSNTTKYYWKVRSHNSVGYSDWSTVWSFTTKYNGGLEKANMIISTTPENPKCGETFTATWTIKETNGVGVTLMGGSVEEYDWENNLISSESVGEAGIKELWGTTRLEPNGALSYTTTEAYLGCDISKSVFLVYGIDDNDNTVRATYTFIAEP